MEGLAKLECLWIGGRELKAVPLFIEHLAGTLEHLHIYRSKIESLPEFIFKLTKLQATTILGCHLLPNIPDSINGLEGSLRNLHFLHCSGLERLPESPGDLTNLEMLDLQACQHLETLPKTLGRLSKLQTLELNGCENLVEFPDAESISNLSKRCRQKICEFIQFRCEQNIMAGRYVAAEQNVEYMMTLRPSDPIFKKLHELIDEEMHNLKSELALVSTDIEWLRQQAWQKVVVNDIQQAAVFIDRMVEVDPESEFALLCRSTLRTLVGDLKGSEADTQKMISDRARREQAVVELPQLYPDSLKKWKPFLDKLDIRGALLAILKVDGSEEAGTTDMTVSLPGKEDLATSAWKHQPARAAALRKQAQTMTGLGDYFGAVVILDATEKLDPDNVSTLNDRGDAKLLGKDGPGAYRDYNRVLELDPNNAEALVSRARMRWASCPCDLEGALLDCDKAVALKRGWPGPLRMRGFVKCKMGDFDGALADLDMSYEIQPDRYAMQYKEGLEKWKLGDFEGALEDFGFQYRLLPDGSPLRTRIERLSLGNDSIELAS